MKPGNCTQCSTLIGTKDKKKTKVKKVKDASAEGGEKTKKTKNKELISSDNEKMNEGFRCFFLV